MATVTEITPRPTNNHSNASGEPLRVLIVEDNAVDAELTVSVLKRAGYPLYYDVVDSAAAYEKSLANASYNLILCDHNLITWTGMDALATLKRMGKDIPFVAVSAVLGDEAAVEYIKRGATDYVLKHRLERLPVVVGRAMQEKAYRDEEARLQNVIVSAKKEWELTFDAVPDLVLLIDNDCRIQRANRATAEYAQLPFSQIIGRHCYEALLGAAGPPVGCPRASALDGSCERRGEFRDAQSSAIFEATVSPIRERSGSVSSCVCVMRDITARKRADEQLHNSEIKYRRLFESAGDGILIVDALSGEISDVNPHLLDLLEFPREEFVGKKLWEVAAFKDREACKRAFQEMKDKESIRYEYLPLQTSGGRQIDVEFVSNSHQVGNLQMIQCNVRDVTERKQAQEAVSRVAAIVASSSDAIIGKTPDGIIVNWNQAAEKMYGYTAEEVKGHSVAVLTPPELPDQLPQILDTVKKGERIAELETVRVRKDGTRVDVSLSVFPIRDKAGQIIGVSSIARDISSRKRDEEALRESNQKLEALVRFSPLAIVAVDRDGKVTEWNSTAEQLHGWKRNEVIGILLPIIPEDGRSRFQSNLATLAEGKVLAGFETDLCRKNGSRYRANASVAPLYDREGRVSGSIGIIQDVTERMHYEKELAFNHALLVTQQESSPDGILVVDEQRRILSLNQRFLKMWDVPPGVEASRSDEQAVQAVLDKLLDPQKFLKNLSYIYEHPSEKIHDELRLKDGRTFDRFALPMVGADGTFHARVFYFRDITERIKMEEALRQGEERYRELLENANDAIFTTDLTGNFTSFNKMAEQTSGYTRDEAIKMNIDQMLAPEYIEKSHREIQRALVTGGSLGAIEVEILTKDGQRKALEVSARITSQDGKPVGQLGIARDTTGRKLLEAQLRQAQKMEAVGRLAGGIAHDFNNLLGVILGYGELLLQQLETSSPQYRQVDLIKKAAERGASLTQQLLAFGRKQVLEPRVIDLNAVIRENEQLLRRLIGENIQLNLNLNSPIGHIKADPAQIVQVIMNLAINSRDAMPDGGKLTVESANTELDEYYVRTHADVRPGRYVVLAVEDTGVGMNREILSHIFEPFFTTKAPGKDTGLGLSTVYGIMRQSNGHVSVYSEESKGSTFKLYFPLIEERLDTPAPPPIPKALEGSETILLVEDEPSIRELARELLEQKGYLVLEATDPKDALNIAACQLGTIHVLLTDVVMPGMSGPELANRLVSLRPYMKVIYMSGYTNNLIADLDNPNAPAHFIGKPFTQEALLSKVREVLQRSERK